MKEKSVQQMRRLIDGQGQIDIQIGREKKRNKEGQRKNDKKREVIHIGEREERERER